ncbi:hypothetical protein HU200_066520 [Digitaria exilis]|uniref:Uncharacterized protein n=1 Tax=Digitaria exilis TaxID=1010633 RepID=A0A835A048_9POAL|nr:hypothetical protein HU200_066520 [Digitaria exilis]
MSEAIDTECGKDFESIGKLWLSKNNLVINIFTSAALWGLWKLRNFICFQKWALERCSISVPKDNWDADRLEDPLSSREHARLRAKAMQDEILGGKTWEVGELTNILEQNLPSFIMHITRREVGADQDQLAKSLAYPLG